MNKNMELRVIAMITGEKRMSEKYCVYSIQIVKYNSQCIFFKGYWVNQLMLFLITWGR